MLAILHQLWVVPVTQQGISYRRFLLFLKLIQLLLLYAFLRTGVRSVHSLVRQTFSVILTLFSFFPTPDLSDTYLIAKALSFTFSISRRDFRTVSFSRLYRASHLYLLHEINACRRLGESFQGVTPSFQFSK